MYESGARVCRVAATIQLIRGARTRRRRRRNAPRTRDDARAAIEPFITRYVRPAADRRRARSLALGKTHFHYAVWGFNIDCIRRRLVGRQRRVPEVTVAGGLADRAGMPLQPRAHAGLGPVDFGPRPSSSVR